MKVFVYYNLHKKTFSIKDTKTNLVVNHSDMVVLKNGEFKVSQSGRARVLKEKRKNVHAGAKGELVDLTSNQDLSKFTEVTYNPYLYDSFVNKNTLEPVYKFNLAILKNKRVFVKELL